MISRRNDAMRRAMARMTGAPPPDAEAVLSPEQDALIAHWAKNPWNFLTGVDLDGKTPIYNTKDEKDRIEPVKPFPGHLDYIKVWVQILFDPTEDFILADKCRQMFLTTATLAYMLWECLFLPGRRWLLSKSTEDEAKDLIRDKIRFPVSRMPRWVREHFAIADRPELRVDVGRTGSYILGVAQNVAVRDARGGTASGVLVDEAAFQDQLGDIISACLPMSAKQILITTPNLVGAGAKVFRTYRDDEIAADYFTGGHNPESEVSRLIDEAHGITDKVRAKFKKLSRVKGMEVKKTRRGCCVVSLDWFADPKRDEAWLNKMRTTATNESSFQAEIMRNWDVSPGVAFYEEFQRDPKLYIQRLPKLINAPVYRGWDFGGRNPACLTPDARVLCYDLKWRAVGSLRAGDGILAFDEFASGGSGSGRCWTRGTILSAERAIKQCVKVALDDGTEFTCSEDHKFLGTFRSKVGQRPWGNHWIEARDLEVGTILPRFFDVWDEPSSYQAGWVAGFYDGEGAVMFSAKGGRRMSIQTAQVKNGLLDHLVSILKSDDFAMGRRELTELRPNQQNTEKLDIQGGWTEMVRFLGTYRPARLLSKFERLFPTRGPHMQKQAQPRVVSIEPIGRKEVVVLETSTRTYIAEGFGHHNCVWLQYSPKTGRVWVVRELLMFGMDIYSFRDLVMYLSGQREESFLMRRPAATEWLEALKRDPLTPPELRVTPWFSHSPTSPLQFLDYAGHEANQAIGREAGNVPLEFTRAQILAAEGIFLNVHYTTTKAKTDIIRRLLQPFPDGRPGLFIDPACKILIRGFSGGITYAAPSPNNPDPLGPSKDDIYSHLHESIGYVLVNAVPLDALPRPQEPRLIGFDQREPMYAQDEGDVLFDADDTKLDF